MEKRHISVECDTLEQKNIVHKFARRGTSMNIFELEKSTGRYIVLFHESQPNFYEGCHCAKEWCEDNKHTIISYEEFEHTYLNPEKMETKLIIGEYYSTNDGWIFNHVDPVNYQCNNYAISPTGRYWHGTAAIANINNGKQGIKPATLEEKRWLHACIRAGRFVSKEDTLKRKEMELIVGKWYDFDGQYGKFHKQGDYDTFYFEPWIVNKKTYGKSGAFSKKNVSDAKEITDLSIIYPFLPEGHPDKIEEPIIGEYYTVRDPNVATGCMVGKVISINEDNSDGDKRGKADYIVQKFGSENGLYLNCTWCYKDDRKRTFQKSTPEEIKWLNKCLELNKFVTFEEAMKEDSLVGRYIKALIDYPNMGGVRAGEYGKIRYWNYNGGNADFPSQKNYAFHLDNQKDGLPAYELMPKGWTPDMEIEKQWLGKEWIPEVGEYAVMEKAGGWGYNPENNGCVAIIENVKSSANDYKISGKIINPKIVDRHTKFIDIPIKTHQGYICRKATPEEIAFAEQIPKKITAMNGKFSIGETVQFITRPTDRIPAFEASSSIIDPLWIKHGNTYLKENKGRVEAIVGDYYIVSYIDRNNQTVQLGFKEDVLSKYYPEAGISYDEEVTISLIKPKKEVIIETNVKQVYSVDTQLVKPKKAVLF